MPARTAAAKPRKRPAAEDASHFTLRFTPEDRQRLKQLEHHYALNGTSVIRMLLKREADAILLHTHERAKALGRTG